MKMLKVYVVVGKSEEIIHATLLWLKVFDTDR